jgi:hypothetical protein
MERADSPYLPITWASDIEADFLSKEESLVTGKLPTLESDWQSSRDAFRRYLTSVKLEFGQKGTGRPSPHLTFGNAVSDDALIGFVGEFGPVVAKDVVEIEPTQPEWTLRPVVLFALLSELIRLPTVWSSAPSPDITTVPTG